MYKMYIISTFGGGLNISTTVICHTTMRRDERKRLDILLFQPALHWPIVLDIANRCCWIMWEQATKDFFCRTQIPWIRYYLPTLSLSLQACSVRVQESKGLRHQIYYGWVEDLEAKQYAIGKYFVLLDRTKYLRNILYHLFMRMF